MLTNPYSYFLNQLQINSAGHKLFFDVRVTTKIKSLIRLLVELNVVRRFHVRGTNFYRVFPAYSRFSGYTRDIKTYARVNARIRLRLKAIRIISVDAPRSHYILETNKGLMTHREALERGIGGVLLLTVH